MTGGPHRPRAGRWAWLSYRRQQTLSLVVLAVIPVLALSLVGYQRIRAAVGDAANAQAADAVRAVRSILSRDGAQLDASVQSYATWTTLQDEIARLDLVDIKRDVLDFQVERGGADAALLMVGPASVQSGDVSVGTSLQDWLATALRTDRAGVDAGYSYASLNGGVYQLAAASIALGNRTGPGATEAAGEPIGLVFARRLDSSFVLDIKQQTGFDVGIYDAAGALTVASNVELAPRSDAGAAAQSGGTTIAGDQVVSETIPLTGDTGNPVGLIRLATSLEVVDVIGGELFPILVTLLGLTLAGALVGAALLSIRLRRRLDAVAAGITAVAAGDLTVRLPEGDRDDLERLAGSHNRLASALARRDELIRDSFAALQRLRVDQGVDRLAQDAVDAAVSVYGLSRCWLRAEDGTVIARAPGVPREPTGDTTGTGKRPGATSGSQHAADPAGAPGDRRQYARAEPETDLSERATLEPAPVWLEATPRTGDAWTSADRALFALFAREVGVALRDAALYERSELRVDRLTRVNALQRDFLRGVSHNLQTPVTAIIAAADDLRERARADSAEQAELELIHGRAVRLAHTVGQLLTVARMDAGVYQPESDLIAPARIVRRAWEAQASDRPLDLDDRAQGALALGDAASLEQAVWILFDNALRYAPGGGVRVEIRRAHSAAAEALEIRVMDEGPGVPAAEQAQIFQRFQRGSTSQGKDGTGLGLAVARGMLEAMGGRIWYEDRPGGGSVFVLALPAEVAAAPV